MSTESLAVSTSTQTQANPILQFINRSSVKFIVIVATILTLIQRQTLLLILGALLCIVEVSAFLDSEMEDGIMAHLDKAFDELNYVTLPNLSKAIRFFAFSALGTLVLFAIIWLVRQCAIACIKSIFSV